MRLYLLINKTKSHRSFSCLLYFNKVALACLDSRPASMLFAEKDNISVFMVKKLSFLFSGLKNKMNTDNEIMQRYENLIPISCLWGFAWASSNCNSHSIVLNGLTPLCGLNGDFETERVHIYSKTPLSLIIAKIDGHCHGNNTSNWITKPLPMIGCFTDSYSFRITSWTT